MRAIDLTKEICRLEAKKYRTRTQFQHESGTAYEKARVNGWLDDVCAHMESKTKQKGHWTFDRCIEEARKYETRTEFRKAEPTAYRKICKEGWGEYAFAHAISSVELRKVKDKQYCREEALKYQAKQDFQKGNKYAYSMASKNGWLQTICSHMTTLKVPKSHWTKERCQKEALKYRTRTLFISGSNGAYRVAKENGWLEEITSHMPTLKKLRSSWTKKKCQEEATKYRTRTAFQAACGGAFKAAKEKGWLDDICSHMKPPRVPKEYWTFERCLEEAKKYGSRSEFSAGSRGAYTASRDNKWLDKVCVYMDQAKKEINYWTKRRVAEEARNFKTQAEFFNHHRGAKAACNRNGWELVFVSPTSQHLT